MAQTYASIDDSVSERAINYVRTGPQGGIPVVLLHPLGFDLTCWDAVIDTLSPHYDVIAVDLPGHGRSAPPAQYSFDLYARTVVELVQSLLAGSGIDSQRAHVIGLSFGSMVAQTIAVNRSAFVASLTLIAASCRLGEEGKQGMVQYGAAIQQHGMKLSIQDGLVTCFSPSTRSRRPHVVDRAMKQLLSTSPVVYSSLLAIGHFDVFDQLTRVKCPTMVLVGELDPNTPLAAAKEIAQQMPHAELHVIAGAAHITHLDAPEVVHAHLARFLSSVGP